MFDVFDLFDVFVLLFLGHWLEVVVVIIRIDLAVVCSLLCGSYVHGCNVYMLYIAVY